MHSSRSNRGVLGRRLPLLLAMLAPLGASAQWSPTGGHYAAQSSNTGFSGAVNSTGGYSASVPLDLPTSHGGLQVPVQIVYTANRVGAAGRGWDVPLSYVARPTTAAHRRPVSRAGEAALLRDQLLVVLDGQASNLVLNAGRTAWVAQRNGAQLEVHDQGDGAFVLYDGNGQTYAFSAEGGVAGSRLDEGNLSLLRDVTGPGGSHVHLEYGITAPTLPGGDIGMAIDLKAVRYNPDASGNCYKHQITLTYDAPTTKPLSLSLFNTTTWARLDKVTGVSVTSRPSDTAGAPCGTGVSLRTYALNYQNDEDTGLPQLQSVAVNGEKGTPEFNTTLPIATYTYGPSSLQGEVKWVLRDQIPMPGGYDPTGLSSTLPDPQATVPATIPALYHQGEVYNTWQGFTDMNGDGRAELTFNNGGQLAIGVNVPTSQGHFAIGPSTATGVQQLTGNVGLPDDILPPGPLELRTRRSGTITASVAGINDNLLWRQVIDVNGDGRLDIIDAEEQAGEWVVYLNLPAPDNPQVVMWARRSISIAPIVQELTALGYEVSPDYVPLGRQLSGGFNLVNTCWQWVKDPRDATKFVWLENSQGYAAPAPNKCTGFDHNHDIAQTGTTTEWELRDVNGDGYPDFVYDTAPVKTVTTTEGPPSTPGTQEGQFKNAFFGTFNTHADDTTRVMLNATGVLMGDLNQSVFTAPMAFTDDGCPLGLWDAPAGFLACGIVDVNGDGIVDRFESAFTQEGQWQSTFVTLGTGNASGPFFSGVELRVPGPISSSDNPFDPCAGHPPLFETQLTGALRDINGDGTPDYIRGIPHGRLPSGTVDWTVSFGTGTGFGPAKTILTTDSSGGLAPDAFALSREADLCTSTRADTTSGLYDLDGDGRPEMVVAIPGNKIAIYQVATAPSNAGSNLTGTAQSTVFFHPIDNAGRLQTIQNGYGATTTISYRSAKSDGSTLHQVPFPEMVVDTVTTTGPEAGQPVLSTAAYAYGGAEQIFDAATDAFVFTGYQRRVTLVGDGSTTATGQGSATLIDTFGVTPFDPAMDSTARLSRYLRAGRPKAVTQIAGSVGTDAWALLATNVQNDPRRTGGVQYDWSSKILPSSTNPSQRCTDMVYPYDWVGSALYEVSHLSDVFDQCTQIGFVYKTTAFNWRGRPGTGDPLTSGQTVGSSSTVTAIDLLGRVTDVRWNEDLQDADLCAHTQYASPTGTGARVLNAAVTRTTSDCGSKILTQQTWEYDTSDTGQKLGAGKVSNGFVTAQTISRRGDNGAPIPDATGKSDVRIFDATYDVAGNLKNLTSTRDDGATRTTMLEYEPFGLAPTKTTVAATNADGTRLPTLTTTTTLDPITLDVLTTSDPNGRQDGATYDGFGRRLLSTVNTPDGRSGVLSSARYLGFAQGDSSGRRIVAKLFVDPVATDAVATAAGRTSTTYLDSIGRTQELDAPLGADYPNQVLAIGQRTYDTRGRVVFEAYPHPSSESLNTAYGTTHYYNADGTPSCTVRGNGAQPFTNVTDEGREIEPTCFTLSYIGNRETVSVQGPDALLSVLGANGPVGSPQFGEANQTVYDAAGRVRERRRGRPSAGASAVEDRTSFDYDALSHLSKMTRWGNPVTLADGVVTQWHTDSLGQVTELDDPGSIAQLRSYNTWGDLVQTQWTDTKRTVAMFDAFDRIVHQEDQVSQTVDATTVNDYVYDQGVTTTTPALTPTYVLGRLAKATAQTSAVAFSYDGLGRINAQVFTDRASTTPPTYVEKHDYHADGTLNQLEWLLPDNNYQAEDVRYTYDTANRLRSVAYQNTADGSGQTLFNTTMSGDLDVFGRVRHATYGLTSYTVSYADSGRRLLNDVKVTAATAPGAPVSTREIAYGPILHMDGSTITNLPAFDPVGRERGRTESVNGVPKPQVLHDYDRLGQLVASSISDGSSSGPTLQRSFTYDALGNLTKQDDPASGTQAGAVQLSYALSGADKDRVCAIGYAGAGTSTSGCSVQYDTQGNITQMPTRSGSRSLIYQANGNISTVLTSNVSAHFDYDAFGLVQRQIVGSSTSPDVRHDKFFGGTLTQRDEGGASVLTRHITAGTVGATRHGANGKWTFALGEKRGNRFVTDEAGVFVQAKDYQPFGEAIASAADDALSGGQAGTALHSAEQWNGGDALEALGVSRLGARIYDPVIGRFLSRDPLVLTGPAARSNAYAFADNDPVNGADPDGLCSEGGACLDGPTCVGLLCVGGGGSPSGNPGGSEGGRGGGGSGTGRTSAPANTSAPDPYRDAPDFVREWDKVFGFGDFNVYGEVFGAPLPRHPRDIPDGWNCSDAGCEKEGVAAVALYVKLRQERKVLAPLPDPIGYATHQWVSGWNEIINSGPYRAEEETLLAIQIIQIIDLISGTAAAFGGPEVPIAPGFDVPILEREASSAGDVAESPAVVEPARKLTREERLDQYRESKGLTLDDIQPAGTTRLRDAVNARDRSPVDWRNFRESPYAGRGDFYHHGGPGTHEIDVPSARPGFDDSDPTPTAPLGNW